MIKFKREIFKEKKLKEESNFIRRRIWTLLKNDHRIKGEQIELALKRNAIDISSECLCIFCGLPRRIKTVDIYIDDEYVIFKNITFQIKSKVCIEGANPNCQKHQYSKTSQKYLKLVLSEQEYITHENKVKESFKGRYTLQWYISKYGEEQGTIKYKERGNKLKNVNTKDWYIKKYGKEEGIKNFNSFVEKCKKGERNFKGRFNLEWFINRYGEEQGPLKYKEHHQKVGKSKTKEGYIKRFGKEIGERKWNKYCNLKRKLNTEESYISRYGKEIGSIKYNEWKKKCSSNIDNYIDRYGKEEGTIKYNKWKNSLKGKCSKKWFINRYGKEEGIEKYNQWKKSCVCNLEVLVKKYGKKKGRKIWSKMKPKFSVTIDNMIEKYGKEEGTKRYNKWLSKILKNIKVSCYSKMSQELFWFLLSKIENKKDIQFGEHSKELRLLTKDGKSKLYDFTDTKQKKIIEFNGDYWHANPSKFKSDDIIFGRLTAKELWERDKEKIKLAKDNGYDILIIWEAEFSRNKKQTFNKCLQFLKVFNTLEEVR